MTFAAVAGIARSGYALPTRAPQRQSMERIGRESIYRDRNAVQTKPATSTCLMGTPEELIERIRELERDGLQEVTFATGNTA